MNEETVISASPPDAPLRDVDLFLDAPPPPELNSEAHPQVSPAPESPAAPAPPPALSSHMLALASSFGITDAAEYSSDAELARAIKLMNTMRPIAHAQRPEQPVAPTPAQAADIVDEFPDFDPAIYDDNMQKLSKALKAQKAKYEADLKKIQDSIPQQVAAIYQQAQAAEKGKKLLSEAVTEAGYDAAKLEDATLQEKIVGMASAMIRQAEQMGIAVDRKAMVKQVLPFVLGAPAVAAPAQGGLAGSIAIDQQRAAIAAQQRARDEKGRYAPGTPTHRTVAGEANGSATRQMLMDLGIDPKGQPVKDDADTFL